MNSLVWVFAFVLIVVGATVGSTKRVTEGNEALVERLGRYHRKLAPGLNFGILPFVDEVVVEASTREQTLDIEPSDAITKDNVTVSIDAVVFWRILELQQLYYGIDDIQEALKNLVITTLRSEIGKMMLQDTYASRTQINKALLESLDEATEPWGVKVTRVEVQEIKLPEELRRSLEQERAAQSLKKAAIARAEGERQAAIARAEGERQAAIQQAEAIARSVQQIREVLGSGASDASIQAILNYLVTQRYVDANMKLGESQNAKIVFMDPKRLTEGIADLIEPEIRNPRPPGHQNGSSGSGGN